MLGSTAIPKTRQSITLRVNTAMMDSPTINRHLLPGGAADQGAVDPLVGGPKYLAARSSGRRPHTQQNGARGRGLLLPMLSEPVDLVPPGQAMPRFGSVFPGSSSPSQHLRERPLPTCACWFCGAAQDTVVGEPYYEHHTRVTRCWFCNATLNEPELGRRNLRNLSKALLQRAPHMTAGHLVKLLAAYANNTLGESELLSEVKKAARNRPSDGGGSGGESFEAYAGDDDDDEGEVRSKSAAWILPPAQLKWLVEAKGRITSSIGSARRFSQLLTAKAVKHSSVDKGNKGMLTELPEVAWVTRTSGAELDIPFAVLDNMNDVLHRMLATEQPAKGAERKVRTVTLNVGGRIFQVEVATLLHNDKRRSDYFRNELFPSKQYAASLNASSKAGAALQTAVRTAVARGRFIGCDDEGLEHYATVEPGPDGAIFIDRTPDYFPFVLEFMRSGELPALKSLSDEDISALKSETAAFGLDAFAQVLEREASNRRAKLDSDEVKALHAEMRELAATKAREVAETLRVQKQAHGLELKSLAAEVAELRRSLVTAEAQLTAVRELGVDPDEAIDRAHEKRAKAQKEAAEAAAAAPAAASEGE